MIATFELTSPSVRDIMCGGILCDGKQAQSLLISCDIEINWKDYYWVKHSSEGLTSFPLNTWESFVGVTYVVTNKSFFNAGIKSNLRKRR